MAAQTLQAHLNSFCMADAEHSQAVMDVISALADAALEVGKLTAQGSLNAGFAASRKTANSDGDVQKELDVVADQLFLAAVKDAPVALYGSEENTSAILIDPAGPISLAIDPLDGSSNIETNVSIGTIFSILPTAKDPATKPEETFFQPGNRQLAAGFFIYGPQLALVLTVGNGTQIFVHSPKYGDFIEAYDSISIPPDSNEFAINASNYRHWDEPVRLYIDDCVAGAEGPMQKDCNMRWVASLVADTFRILIRGGVFLYPSDKRRGYKSGRLRLVYEANPIAFVVEQAGGQATDAVDRILDLRPTQLHQRTPLIFGSSGEVERISRYHVDPSMIGERSPLFGNRGLFRA